MGVLPYIAALIPLAMAPGLHFYFDVTPKVALIYAGAALVPLVRVRPLLASAAGRWFCAIAVMTVAAAGLSTAFSARPDLSIDGTTWRRFGLISQIAIVLFAVGAASDLISRPDRLRTWLRASTAATIALSLYGIAQFFGYDPWIDKKLYHVGEGAGAIVRPPGSMGYVTYLANWLVFGFFQAIAWLRLEPSTRGPAWLRLMAIAAIVLSAVAIVLSGTRAAMLAVVAGCLFLWIMDGRRLPRRVVIAMACGSAALALFVLSPAGQPFRNRIRWFREDPAGGARLALWRESTRLAMAHPLAGAGLDAFAPPFAKVQSDGLARAFPDFYHESAHNALLDTAATQGLPGLAAFLGAMGLCIWIIRRHRGSALVRALGAGLAAVLTAHQFSVFTAATSLTFWLPLAILVSLTAAGVAPRTPIRRWWVAWTVPVSLAMMLLAIRLVAGDFHMQQARSALETGRIASAEEQVRRAANLGVRADLWYSRKLLSMSQSAPGLLESAAATQYALRAGEDAVRTSEDVQNAWLNLALIYARLNNSARTEECIRSAIAAAPNWYRPHLALGKLLLATGRVLEARQELEIAAKLNANSSEIRDLLANVPKM